MYSAIQSMNALAQSLLLDKTSLVNVILFANPVTSRVYESEKDTYIYSVRPVITLNKNVTIKEGKGTASEPYYVR